MAFLRSEDASYISLSNSACWLQAAERNMIQIKPRVPTDCGRLQDKVAVVTGAGTASARPSHSNSLAKGPRSWSVACRMIQ